MERHKLTILEVKEPQKVGDKGAQKLSFKAKHDGKDQWYFTFRPGLFDAIREHKGQEVEVDVEVTTKDVEGNTYVDRNVSQVYVDGQPVGVRGAGRGFSQGKSPEEIASIECQVAAKLVGELWLGDKLGEDSPEVKGLRQWLSIRMGYDIGVAGLGPQKQTKTDEPKGEPALNTAADRWNAFSKEMKRLGCTNEAARQEWLNEHEYPMTWKELTDEAQQEAVAKAQTDAEHDIKEV